MTNREIRTGRRSAAKGGMPAVSTRGLVYGYGKTAAVAGVDLEVASGEIYGVLGPNGAGKTTTLRLLATLLRPHAGEARVFGYDVVREANEVRRRVGLTGQFASLDEDLTGRENLLLVARLLGYRWADARGRADELLGAFELTEVASKPVKTYSGGLRRRLDIAASLIVTPDLLFLDEPTTGLDPRSRNGVWEAVRALAAAGTTVLLTTQYLEEADRLADRLAVIDRGRVIATGTPSDLKASAGAGVLHLRLRDGSARPKAERLLWEALGVPAEADPDPAALSLRVTDTARVAPALAELAQAEGAVTSFSLGQPSLDEVFLALTGRPAEAPPARMEEEA